LLRGFTERASRYGTFFPGKSVAVSMATKNDNLLGVYAGANDAAGTGFSLVLVNKDTKPVSLNLANVPSGTYFLRHFGGQAGVAKYQVSVNSLGQVARRAENADQRLQTTITLSGSNYIVVPAYTAAFLQKK
jgi:hypothetical protein